MGWSVAQLGQENSLCILGTVCNNRVPERRNCCSCNIIALVMDQCYPLLRRAVTMYFQTKKFKSVNRNWKAMLFKYLHFPSQNIARLRQNTHRPRQISRTDPEQTFRSVSVTAILLSALHIVEFTYQSHPFQKSSTRHLESGNHSAKKRGISRPMSSSSRAQLRA